MTTCFILCDTLRADHVRPDTMPHLYNLAMTSTHYTMFWGDGGNTKQSMPHFLSGQREYDQINSFPSTLTNHDVKNTIVHSNAVLVREKYQDCFQHMVDMGVEQDPVKTTLRRGMKKLGVWNITKPLRREVTGGKTFNVPYRRAENMLNVAQRELDRLGDGFLWVQLMDPHIPYSPPGLSNVEQLEATKLYDNLLKSLKDLYEFNELEKRRLRQLYARECRYMDQYLSEFIEANPDTLFMVSSDHGDMFGVNYTYSHSPGPHGVTPQLGHLPLIIHGRDVGKKTVTRYNSSINIGATILDLYGLETRCGYGRSFLEDFM